MQNFVENINIDCFAYSIISKIDTVFAENNSKIRSNIIPHAAEVTTLIFSRKF